MPTNNYGGDLDQEESGSLFGDLAAAPFRGVEGAIQDVYGLADSLTGDALPDYEERFLGQSTTLAGGLVEGIFNFAAGFHPAVSILGKAGKLSKGAQLAAKTRKGAKAIEVGRFAAAGAISDFAVFDGHEARLSDLLQDHAGLSDAVTGYLASDETDSEAEGRLKNVLEGLGIGAALGGLVVGVKALKAVRSVRAKGGTVDEAIDAFQSNVLQTQLDKSLAGQRTLGENSTPEEILDELGSRGLGEARKLELKQVDKDLQKLGFIPAKKVKGSLRALGATIDTGGAPREPLKNTLSPLGITDEDATEIFRQVRERGTKGLPQGIDPKKKVRDPASGRMVEKYSDADLLHMQIARSGLNLAKFEGLGADHLKRTLEEIMRPTWEVELQSLEVRRLSTVQQEMVDDLAAITGKTTDRLMAELGAGADIPNAFAQAKFKAQVHTLQLEVLARDMDAQLLKVEAPNGGTPANVARLVQMLGVFNDSLGIEQAIKAERSRVLGELRVKNPQLPSRPADLRDPIRPPVEPPAGSGALGDLGPQTPPTSSTAAPRGARGKPAPGNRFGEDAEGIVYFHSGPRVPHRPTVPKAADLSDPEYVKRLIDAAGGEKAVAKLAKTLRASLETKGVKSNKAAYAEFLKGTISGRLIGMTHELWVGMILSGGKTTTVNNVGNAATSVYVPLERLVGAKIYQAFGGGDAAALEAKVALHELFQVLHGWTNAEFWKWGWSSAKANKPVLTAGDNSLFDIGSRKPKITRQSLPPKYQDTILGSAAEWLGKGARAPGALLQGGDNVAKTVTFRAVGSGQFFKEGLEQGMTATQAAEYAADKVKGLIDEGQAYSLKRVIEKAHLDADRLNITDPTRRLAHVEKYAEDNFDEGLSKISQLALSDAAYATHTVDRPAGSLSKNTQQMVNNHPMLSFLAPFIRTPTNLALFALQRYDVPGAVRVAAARISPKAAAGLEHSRVKMVQDLTSGDPRQIAAATGRMAAGITAGVTAYKFAMEGLVTGSGPADHEHRRLMENAGWLPYSIKVGDQYVQYNRLDPFASMIGLYADMAEYGRWAHPDDSGVMAQFGMAGAISLAHNFTNKTYFTGVTSFLNAMSDPERYMPKLLQRYAGSFVPNILGQSVVPQFDDRLIDARSWVDAMRKKVPGLSSDLEPYRNVLGEPIMRTKAWGSGTVPILDAFLPIAARSVSDRVVDKELKRLGHGFTPISMTQQGLDLTDFRDRSGRTAYDLVGELSGTVTIGGRTLREDLRGLMKSARYKAMQDAEAFAEVSSPKIAEVNRVIARYRREAFRQTVSSFPELGASLKDNRERKRQARLGTLNQ